MKKISLSILLMLVCVISVFAISACDENHTCDYVYRIPSRTFLASEPSCTAGGTYYTVCRCGNISNETFEYEKPLPHEYVNEIAGVNNVAKSVSCTNPATYYKTCICGANGTETFTVGEPLEHTYDQCVETDEYLITAPTYVSRGQYYYSCVCGRPGDTAFEGNYLVAPGSDGLVFELSADQTYYVLTSVSNVTDTNLIIPVAFQGKYVKEINISDYDAENTAITSVVIPEEVTLISTNSFSTCKRLCEVINHSDMELDLGDGLALTANAGIIHTEESSHLKRENGSVYFVDDMGQVHLVSLNISHTNLPSTINGQSYRLRPYSVNCSYMTNLVIPEGVLSVSASAFYNADNVQHVVIPSSVGVIETAFMNRVSSGNTIILCKGDADGEDWLDGWNYYNDPVYYGYSGNQITYYLYSLNDYGYEYYDSITSAYPITLPTPTNGIREFEGWYLDEHCEESPTYIAGKYYNGESYEDQLFAKWGDEVRDGLSRDTAIILTDNCYRDVSVQSGALYYEFTVTRSGSYSIYSTGSYDTRAWLLNYYGGEITFNDDGGSGNNFSMSATLTAGETYYVKAQQYSGGSADFHLVIIPSSTTSNLGFTLSYDGTYYILTSVANVTEAEIIIPAVYQSKPVKEIDIPSTDTENRIIQSVVIPETVESISYDSFSNCPRLIEVINRSELELSYSDGRVMTSRAIVIHSELSSRIVRTYHDPNQYNITYDYIVDDAGEVYLLNIGGDLYSTPHDVVLPATINASYYHITSYSVNAQLCGTEKMIIIPYGALSIANAAIYNADSLKALVIRGEVGAMGSGILKKQLSAATTNIYYNASFVTSEWDANWNLYGDNVIDNFTDSEITYSFNSEYEIALEDITSDLPIILPTPVSTLYEFEGWYDNPDFEGTPISGTYYSAEDITLYAKWGELTRDGLSRDTAIILTDNCYFDYASSSPLYFEFIATRSGSYSIYSTGNYDTKAWLLDAYGNELDYDDDTGSDYNFSIPYQLTAGERYFIKAQRYSDNSYAEFRLCICPSSTTSNLGFTISPDSTYYILTSVGSVTAEEIFIPAIYNGKPVQAIDIPDSDSQNIVSQSVVIPATVTSISYGSFLNCPRLVEVINRSDVELYEGDGRLLSSRAIVIHSDTTSRIVRDAVDPLENARTYDYIVDKNGELHLIKVDSDRLTEASLSLPETINDSYYHIAPYAINATYSGTDHAVIIPSGVLSIATSAIYNADSLSSLFICGTVSSVGSAILQKTDSDSTTIIFCNESFITDGWDEDWNIHGDTLIGDYTGDEVTYTFSSEHAIDVEYITSALPITLPTPTNGSHAFEGWYDNAEFSGEAITGVYYSSESVTLYAKWSDVIRDGTCFDTAYIIETGGSAYVSTSSYEYMYFKFTAETTGYHRFYSDKYSGDPKIWLYESDNTSNYATSDDDGGSNGNFNLSYYLYAGETVYLKIGYWNGGGSTTLYFYVTRN